MPSRPRGSRLFTSMGRGPVGEQALRLYFNTDVLAVSGVPHENNEDGGGGVGSAGTDVGVLRIEGADLHLYWRGQSDREWKNRSSVESDVNGSSNRAVAVRPTSIISDDGMSGVSKRGRPRAAAVESSSGPSVRGVRGIRGIQGRRYRRQAADGEPTVQVAVYQLASTSSGGARRRISRDDDTDVIPTPLKSVTLKSLAKSRWIKFNVTSAVDDWIKNPKKNSGLQVVVTGRPSTSVKNGRGGGGRRLPGLDGYDCGDQRASGERDREVNSTASGSRRRTRPRPHADDFDLDTNGNRALSGTSYPKLEVSVVRVLVPDVSPSGDRRRNRGDRRTHRRRNPRHVHDDVRIRSSASCDLQYLDVSLQDFSWDEMTIVHPLKHRFTYCDTPNPCPNKTTTQSWSSAEQSRGQSWPSADRCCESIERDPLSVTYRDHVTGTNTTFALADSNVIECRLRDVNDS